MNVRATRIVADPAKAAQGTERYEAMVAAMKEVEGFLGACLLIDRASGNSLGLTFWSSEETLKASEEVANQQRQQSASAIGINGPPTVERFEVAYYGVPEPSSVR